MREEETGEAPVPVQNTDRKMSSFGDSCRGQNAENETDAGMRVGLEPEAELCADADPDDNLDVDALIALLDGCTQAGESRIKLDVVEGSGQVISRQYHHGRCDIGSPWACGTAFDVLE